MGQVPAKQFQPPQPIGQGGQNVLMRSVAPTPLPQNALQPLIQNLVPTVQSPNAVPNSGVAGSNNYPTYTGRNTADDPFGTSSPFWVPQGKLLY